VSGVLVLLAFATLANAPAQDDGQLVRTPRVRAMTLDGRDWYDVQAQNASALSVVREIGRAAGRQVYGLDALARPTLVTVHLEQRPLDQILEYTLGSLGLRYELQASSIRILEGLPESVEEQLDIAAAAWMRAARRFPDHPAAAEARIAQGEIAETKGMLAAARTHYLSLIEDYPNAAVVGEAYMRAGRISSSLGQWGEASRLFRTLADSDVASEYHAAARLEWARAMIAQGDAQSALYMLRSLESNYPAVDRTELTGRRLVRARALNETERYMEALEEIDLADGDFDPFGAWEALHIRAIALEGIGLPSEAARAWLLYAGEAKGHDRAFAYEQAARLSLKSEDELAVIFIVQQAELAGLETGLESYERQARERLGLSIDQEGEGIQGRVARAERLLAEEDFAKAGAILQPLFLARGALDEETRSRVCVGWARSQDSRLGLGAAIDILLEVRPTFTTPLAQQRIDIGAAELFERYDRFEDAIEAYQGRYAKP